MLQTAVPKKVVFRDALTKYKSNLRDVWSDVVIDARPTRTHLRFEEDLKITLQALGWRSGDRYLPLQDDYSSVAYWY